MDKLKVSVITPSFNRGDLIEDTIKSVLGQTYVPIEYIVVDGMSNDQTVNILESYRKRGELRYVSRKDNGMYYAINEGINMASGDIIAYLNSDDLYFPWTVQRAVETFQEDPSVDMVYGDSMVVDVASGKKYLNIYASHKRAWLPAGGILCQPTVFLNRKVIREVGLFNTEYKYLADCEFWLRVNRAEALIIRKIDEVLAAECNHGGTFREHYKEEIVREKEKLLCAFGRHYLDNRLLRMVTGLTGALRKELKMWKFILVNVTKGALPGTSWEHFLGNYSVSFSPANYVLCKIYHNRAKYPRFCIKESGA